MIRGFFERSAPLLRVALFLPGITADWAEVTFLVDSGAAATCLHPHDATTAVGIDRARLAAPEQWPLQVGMRGVGGRSSLFVVPARYGFRHDDGAIEIIDADIHIAQLTAANETLPSLLGRDLLARFQVTLDRPSRPSWQIISCLPDEATIAIQARTRPPGR